MNEHSWFGYFSRKMVLVRCAFILISSVLCSFSVNADIYALSVRLNVRNADNTLNPGDYIKFSAYSYGTAAIFPLGRDFYIHNTNEYPGYNDTIFITDEHAELGGKNICLISNDFRLGGAKLSNNLKVCGVFTRISITQMRMETILSDPIRFAPLPPYTIQDVSSVDTGKIKTPSERPLDPMNHRFGFSLEVHASMLQHLPDIAPFVSLLLN